jgi:hypothetical protein
VFTRTLHWSLSWAISIQPTPSHPISLSSILILSTNLRLGLPRGLFPSGYPTNILYAFLVSPIRATCPAHHILLDLIRIYIIPNNIFIFISRYCDISFPWSSLKNSKLAPRFHCTCIQADRVQNYPDPFIVFHPEGLSNSARCRSSQAAWNYVIIQRGQVLDPELMDLWIYTQLEQCRYSEPEIMT